MEGTTTNGSNAVAVGQTGTVALPTLLGASAQRIPVAGRIRAGIKVLTKRAEEDPRAREIYDRGIEAGQGFETIERSLAQALPDLKKPLTPRNVPWFTVRGEDFPNPHLARQIMEAFAEDRGDGTQRLYRFPVVFPADAWQHVMPHELVAWTTNERRFWSEYSPDGKVRYCKTHMPVPVDISGRRTIRIWGGRKTMLREQNGGVCDPEACQEYQDRRCNLSGRFIFFIPGIKSISAFDLMTNSFYAMNAAIQKFQTIGFMRGGRISGFLDRQRTPFYLTKRLVEISRIGDDGLPKRVSQWLIELEAPVDVTALLRPDESVDAADVRAIDAVNVLEGSATAGRYSGEPPVTLDDVSGAKPAETEGAPTSQKQAGVSEVETTTVKADGERHGSAQARRLAASESGAAEYEDIVRQAEQLGVTLALFDEYASKRWGKGWKFNAAGRRRVRDEILSFASDAAAYRLKVEAEVKVFS